MHPFHVTIITGHIGFVISTESRPSRRVHPETRGFLRERFSEELDDRLGKPSGEMEILSSLSPHVNGGACYFLFLSLSDGSFELIKAESDRTERHESTIRTGFGRGRGAGTTFYLSPI